MPLFRHFLEHHNKWTHSWKHINMPVQNMFYFPDISSCCWEIVLDTLVELGWLSIMCPLFVTHRENSYHISDNISATKWYIKERKPVLKTIPIKHEHKISGVLFFSSHNTMLSGMGSFVMMLQEMPE